MLGFRNSIQQIQRAEHVNHAMAYFKYVIWQLIKLFRFFPYNIRVSNSYIQILNKQIAIQGGTKMFTQGMYDYNNMNLIQSLLSKKYKTFIDIGANIGTYSLIASEIQGASIISFEPHPYTYKLLNDNVKINNRQNIKTYNKAIGKITDIVSFTNVPGSSINKIVSNSKNEDLIEIPCMRLTDFVVAEEIVPDIIKIDVEGYEMEVLLGSNDILKQIKILIIEILSNKNKVTNYLKTNGFEGPFEYNIKKNIFSLHKHSTEDSVFISLAVKKDILQATNAVIKQY